MGETLAVVSATCFGATDVFAGLLSRRIHSSAVALIGQVTGFIVVLVLTPWFAAPEVDAAAIGWGAASGVGTGLGAAFLFAAMSAGRFSVTVPLSVVAGIALPVVVGVLLLGDAPSVLAWCGIVIAVPAVALMTSTGRDERPGPASTAAGARLALSSGVAFALQYIALAQAPAAAGLWPLAANRAASVLVLVPLITHRPERLRVGVRLAAGAAATGVVSAAAITTFALASRQALLSTTVVITSMYPAIPVLLGLTVLRERLRGAQVAGLLCATGAVVLISLR